MLAHVGAVFSKFNAPLNIINFLESVKAKNQSPGALQPVSVAKGIERQAG